MGVVGCSNDGYLNDAKFSEPMPWIGIYIATASLVCLLAMAADLVHGFRHRKFWFPCKFFTLNSTSLTLIAVAIKLSVDLNTSMPGREDQLAKLSSAVLMCTIMANCMPSLGSMENQEIFMNIMALGILVITLIINVCMEMGTGVIYVYMKEQVSILILMLVLLGILSFSALVVPSTKSYLEMKYSLRHELASKECKANEKEGKIAVERLKGGYDKILDDGSNLQPTVCDGSVRYIGSRDYCPSNQMVCSHKIQVSKAGKRGLQEGIHIRKLLDPISGRDEAVSGSEVDIDSKMDLSRFVLYLEGEDDLVHLMIANNYHATHHWIQKGQKKKPKILIHLLEGTIMSRGFKGVAEFDNLQVPCLDSQQPQNCWMLPVVTLTVIATSLPNMNRRLIKHLLRAVNEGLKYIRLIEDHLDTKGDFINLKKAAEIVWLGIDLHHKWLDIDIHKISHHKESPKEVLEQLSNCAKKIYSAEKKTNQHLCLKLSPSKWPIKVLAANCMYRISESMLLKYEKKYGHSSEQLFTEIEAIIGAIMGACLTNLEKVISTKCSNSAIEKREKSVRKAAYILGKTGNILKLIEKTTLPALDPHQMESIEEWRLFYKLEI
ncbi:hypothetical protein SDJN02_11452, partial [Cucurbita argyrosperma subsp. argyrosperma]